MVNKLFLIFIIDQISKTEEEFEKFNENENFQV